MADLALAGIRKSFGSVEILHGIDLVVRDGEFCVFVGPSGCGKSTLLRLIAGLEEVTEGTVAIDSRDVTDVQPAQRGIAMVFQSYALYPHMSVYENMAFGLQRARYPKAEIEQRVRRAAGTLHIENLLTRRPRDLSGGQRQRVAIGRAIVREPKLFLFDEPLSNLDAALRVEMRVELAKLKAELGATIVYVTHDQVEAMTLADRIVVLNDGRIEQAGPPLELYQAPSNLFVAGFIGSPRMNFLPARVAGRLGDDLVVELLGGRTMALPVSQPIAAGASVTLGVRPEHVRLVGDAGLVVPSEVVVAELLGGESHLHVSSAGQTMVVKTDGGTTPRRGERLDLVLPPARCHLFDGDGRRVSVRSNDVPHVTHGYTHATNPPLPA